MNSFIKSTQYRNWTKTNADIENIEKSKVQRIFKRINDVNLIIKKENEEKSHSSHLNYDKTSSSNNNQSKDDKVPVADNEFKRYINPKKYISLEKEKTLIISYSNKLIKILNSQKQKSTSLKNNSITYFRRFFLKKSILDFNPLYLMAASLFLGAKVAQKNFTILDIEKVFPDIKNSDKILFDYEFYLSTILEYDFYVYNPYQALLGFIFTLEQKEFFLAQSSQNYVNPNEFKQECMDLIDKMYLTDNIFLFTYSEIALASIFIKCEQKNINTINIAEKLELDKIIDVKGFLDGPVKIMKQNLDLIPKYESNEDEEKKIKEIYRIVISFHKNFPLYQKKLDEERTILKNKMKAFTDDFDDLLKKNGLEPKKK